MPRRPRLSYPGAFFHVTTRGNNRRSIYEDGLDRHIFLRMLGRIAERYAWRVYAYCLMTTHYHLVLELPENGLSASLCILNGGFARWSNFRQGREDHLFGKRFASIEIVRESHLVNACRYVVLNPVYEGIVDEPGAWPWSSYRATVGEEHAPPYLAVGRLLALFHNRPKDAVARYRAFVAEGQALWSHGLVPGTAPEM